MPGLSANQWLTISNPETDSGMRLFCFPYAGGGAQLFREWHEWLHPQIEVYAIQLPGRGIRATEEPISDLTLLVKTVARALDTYLSKPYVFFGHSLGAIVSFEVVRHLRELGKPLPKHMFFSGCRAPQCRDRHPPIFDLPEEDLIREVRKLNGTPNEVWSEPELIRLLIPVLRADLALSDNYRYIPDAPLPSPCDVFGGIEDAEITTDDLAAWSAQTKASCQLHMMPGDHFFPFKRPESFLPKFAERLSAAFLCTTEASKL